MSKRLAGGFFKGENIKNSLASTNVDPYFDQVSLLLHMDGSNGSTTFTDSSSNALTVTANGGAQISTSQYKWNGASGAFNGSSAYLELADTSSQLLLSGDFTIECWVYFNSVSGTQIIMQSGWDGSGGALALWMHGSYPSKISLWADSYSSGAPIITGTTTLATGTWYHVAATRSGNNWSLYLNGTSQGTATSSATVTRKIRRVGAYSDTSGTSTNYYLNGYIDDLRITKGICRYNSAFTPPTASFPNSSSDQALGGFVTTFNGYTIHKFTSNGTFTVLSDVLVEYLVVAGGGGGGTGFGGGGGAGGFRIGSKTLSPGTYSITVGAGGLGAPGSNANGNPGENSVFDTVTASGGGAGGGQASAGGAGGSGGGGGGTYGIYGGAGNIPATTPPQGNSGAGSSGGTYGGGGGGAGSAGSGANGGTGLGSSISGTWVTYCGGGAGNSTSGLGAAVDGGGGMYGSVHVSAAANRGGGGNGDQGIPESNGGSGVVFIRYVSDTTVLIDEKFDKVAFLLPLSGDNGSTTFTDQSNNSLPVTVNGSVVVSTDHSKFNNGSGYFGPTTGYLSVNNQSFFTLGAGREPFTIEFDMYNTSYATEFILYRGGGNPGFWSVADGCQYTLYIDSNRLYWQWFIGNSPYITAISTPVPPTDAWNNVAVCYDGTTTTMFVNGIPAGTSAAIYAVPYTQNIFTIGNIPFNNFPYQVSGNLNNLRITKGFDRYTSLYVPSLTPFPSIATPPAATAASPIGIWTPEQQLERVVQGTWV